MMSSTPSPIEVPEVDVDEPVAVIPLTSVAPLDGPPDGERINTFAIAPRPPGLREQVLAKPLTYVAAAFAFGFMLARVLR